MNQQDLKKRTKQFALRVIRLTEALPNTMTANVIRRQLLRSGTSVGANYRAACRAKSPAEFVAITVTSINTARKGSRKP